MYPEFVPKGRRVFLFACAGWFAACGAWPREPLASSGEVRAKRDAVAPGFAGVSPGTAPLGERRALPSAVPVEPLTPPARPAETLAPPFGEYTRTVDNHLDCPLAPGASGGHPVADDQVRGWQGEFAQLSRMTEDSLAEVAEPIDPGKRSWREGKIAIIWIEPRYAGGRTEVWFDAAHFLLPETLRARSMASSASLLLIFSRCWTEHPPGAFTPMPAALLWHWRSGLVQRLPASAWVHRDDIAAAYPPAPLARWVARLPYVTPRPAH
jgi:hypothetical protein